jgi:hypothetical protein
MRCIALKIYLVLQQNPTPNFGTTYFFFFPKENKIIYANQNASERNNMRH